MSTRASSRVWKSSSQAVSTIRTGDPAAVSRRYDSHARSVQISAATSPSRRTWVTSPDLYIGLTGTTIAPAFQAPSRAITKWGEFCSSTATRSPCSSPRAARYPATESLSASTSR